MNARVLVNEFVKMRHLHIWLLVMVLPVGVPCLGLFSALSSPEFDRAAASAWNTLLTGVGTGFTVTVPLLSAVLASRLVDVEHRGGGWLLSSTSGVTAGELCRGKVAALGSLLAAATVLASVAVVVTGGLLGITSPLPAGRWIGFTVAVLVVTLAVLAVHIVLAAWVENQLVGVGVGLLGTVAALFASAVPPWIAHLTPWGYYALASAAGYVDSELVARSPAYASIAALGLVVAALFVLFTVALDRQEA